MKALAVLLATGLKMVHNGIPRLCLESLLSVIASL